MKSILTILALILSTSTFADCIKQYDVFKQKKHTTGTLSTVGGVASPPVGVAVFSTAYNMGMAGSYGILGSILATTSIGMTYAAPVLTATGITSHVRASDYGWVREVIKESTVGMGDELEEFAEELSETLDREITVADIAPIIKQANEENIFCSTDRNIFDSADVTEYVENALND